MYIEGMLQNNMPFIMEKTDKISNFLPAHNIFCKKLL